MLGGRLMRMPVIMQTGMVLVKMGVRAGDVRVSGREFLAQPFGDSSEVENAEENEHQSDGKFHRETDTRRNDPVEENDGAADNGDGDGVPQTPEGANESCLGESAFTGDDGGDRDDVIGVGGVTHAEEESDDEDGDAAEHGRSFPL